MSTVNVYAGHRQIIIILTEQWRPIVAWVAVPLALIQPVTLPLHATTEIQPLECVSTHLLSTVRLLISMDSPTS